MLVPLLALQVPLRPIPTTRHRLTLPRASQRPLPYCAVLALTLLDLRLAMATAHVLAPPSACSMSSRELPGNVNDTLPAIEQQYPLPVTPTFAYPEVPAQDQLLDLLNLESAHIPYPHLPIRWHQPTRQAALVKVNHLPRHRVESTRHPDSSSLLPRITGLGTGCCMRSPAHRHGRPLRASMRALAGLPAIPAPSGRISPFCALLGGYGRSQPLPADFAYCTPCVGPLGLAAPSQLRFSCGLNSTPCQLARRRVPFWGSQRKLS